MNTQTCSKSLVLPIGKRERDRKAKCFSASFVRAEKSKFLFTLTVLTWIVAAFVAIVFTFAVRNVPAEADWLACLLLGTLFLGWIMVARLIDAPLSGQGEQHEK
jgi:hypothetical protein